LVVVFSTPVVKLLFERGEFNASSTEKTGFALSWFALGLIAFAIEIPIMQSFFALKDTLTPIIVGIGCVLINILLTLTLVNWIGFIAVPIALSFQKIIKVTVLIVFLGKKIPIHLKNLCQFMLKPILCSIITIVLSVYIDNHFSFFDNQNFYSLIGKIGIGSFAALIIFISFSLILRIEEISELAGIVKSYFLKVTS
jgi:putative peptidoglycan lipid II flippase